MSIRSDPSRAEKHKRSHVTVEVPTFCWIFSCSGDKRQPEGGNSRCHGKPGNTSEFESDNFSKNVNSAIYPLHVVVPILCVFLSSVVTTDGEC